MNAVAERRWLTLPLVTLVAFSLLIGCGWMERSEGRRTDVMLDLSGGPYRSGVPDLGTGGTSSAKLFERPDGVEIKLPGGHAFSEAGHVRTVRVQLIAAHDDQLSAVDVVFLPETGDEAYQRMRRYADQFSLDASSLDAWIAVKRGEPSPNDEDRELVAVHFDPYGGPNGPTIDVRTARSFDSERPFVVTMTLDWGYRFTPGWKFGGTAPPATNAQPPVTSES